MACPSRATAASSFPLIEAAIVAWPDLGERIEAEFKLPVHFVDERLTSYEAESTIPPSQRRALRSSGLVDSRAATLILQDYLETRFPGAPDIREKDGG